MPIIVLLLSWQNDTSTTKLQTSVIANLQTIKTSKDLQLLMAVCATVTQKLLIFENVKEEQFTYKSPLSWPYCTKSLSKRHIWVYPDLQVHHYRVLECNVTYCLWFISTKIPGKKYRENGVKEISPNCWYFCIKPHGITSKNWNFPALNVVLKKCNASKKTEIDLCPETLQHVSFHFSQFHSPFTPYFSKIHFHILLPPNLSLPKLNLRLSFLDRIFLVT